MSVKGAYARLNGYARLLSELNEHYDENLDCVRVFRYSDGLIRAMNEHEVYSPDDAWLVFADMIDELLNELAAVGTSLQLAPRRVLSGTSMAKTITFTTIK